MIQHMDLDILGIAESHLKVGQCIHIPGYKVYSHPRVNLSVKAKKGSGGVLCLVKDEICNSFNVKVLDCSYEGIMWLEFQSKGANFCVNVAVCYLPPQGSTRNVDSLEFYDTLLTQVALYQNRGAFMIMGDFNGRIGNQEDFIAGVDQIKHRQVIDFTENTHGQHLIDFLVSTNCCVLNGRTENDDFTCVSQKGLSVVDFAIVPHDIIDMYSNFYVLRARQLFEDARCVGCYDLTKAVIPDHSVLRWYFKMSSAHSYKDTMEGVKVTKYDVTSVERSFLHNGDNAERIEVLTKSLSKANKEDMDLDKLYESFCSSVKREMVEKVPCKTFYIKNGNNNKKRRVKKAWWTPQLTEMWNSLCKAEKIWTRTKGEKSHLKASFKAVQKQFDREVQKAKRRYWRRQQENLEEICSKAQGEFWKNMGKIGIAEEREKNRMPTEVKDSHGNIITDKSKVTEQWKTYFQELLNVDEDNRETINFELPHTVDNKEPQGLEEINSQITVYEVWRALGNTKKKKAAGVDDICFEVLKNKTCVEFLVSLFNVCFSSGKYPDLWHKGLIVPILKDAGKDRLDPSNYRGITLACTTYKIYCGVLNSRLTWWAEKNNILFDEQNGFRGGRSCIDHITSLTNIIETRKHKKKDTFCLFVDFSKAYDRIDRNKLWTKLMGYGLEGHLLQAIMQIYSKVECCVKLGHMNSLSPWFEVNTGLKQGCLISPLLFSIYINDLVSTLNNVGLGVSIGQRKLSCLLYADDLVVFGNTERDLQRLMSILQEWCNKWSITINTEKSNIVHFRPNSKPKSDFNFMVGNTRLEVVSTYKYLGILLHEHLDYKVTADMVSKSAGRALGLIIAKSKLLGGLPFNTFYKLFQSTVVPIIEYGAAVWGYKEFSSVNSVYNRACRYFLGVGKYAPNMAVQGDTGWTPAFISQWISISRQLCRYSIMADSRINKKIFTWACQEAKKNCRNPLYRIMKFLKDMGRQEWITNLDQGLDKDYVINEVTTYLMDRHVDRWRDSINSSTGPSGKGRNKLRTYNIFKQEYSTELYVTAIMPRSHRSAMAKFRSGTAPLRIETGRYENMAEADRVCPFCAHVVETEVHVIMECPHYEDTREQLIQGARDLNVISDENMSNLDMFVSFFSSSNVYFVRKLAKTCHDILKRRRNFTHKS